MTRAAGALGVFAGILVAAAPMGAARPQTAGPARSGAALAQRASAYVAGYQRAFSFMIADEHYVQRVEYDASAAGSPEESRAPAAASQSRSMRGELFLTFLEADRRWVALHDIAQVDGVEVSGRENLRALLAVSPVESVAARLFRHNARYNIGTILRNFNEPTLALQVLDPRQRPRFSFRAAGPAPRALPSTLVMLEFREREAPTLVRATDGGPVFSSGEMVVDAATGTIRWTRMAFRHESIDAELITTFAWDERLGWWLPAEFAERYAAGPRGRRPAETITGLARYDHYRRFAATGRIAAP